MKPHPVSRWISTGKAAKLLGYCPDHFVRKFDGIIPSRRTGGGHRRWMVEAVTALVNTLNKKFR